MNYYFITPPNDLAYNVIRDAAVRHHMLLGQRLIDSPAYRELYARVRIESGAHHFMVDNGAAEGEVVDFKEIVRAVELNMPSQKGKHVIEITMPDVLFDAEATIRRITDKRNLRLVSPRRRVVIPQGNTVTEWKRCFLELVNRVEFGVLGIPKHLDGVAGGRLVALRFALDQFKHMEKAPQIHLYGVKGSPRHMVHQLMPYNAYVRSVDSGCAVGWAQAGYDVDLDCEPDKHFGVKWNGAYPMSHIAQNVVAMQRMCEGVLDAEDMSDPS